MYRMQIPPEIYLSPSKVFASQNNIFVLDRQKGEVLIQYQMSSINDFTLNKDVLYLIQKKGKFFQALSAINGLPLWHFQIEDDFFLPPSFDDKAVYIGTREGFIYCLELDSGALLWRKELKKTLMTKIAISNKRIYLACKDLNTSVSYMCALSTEDGSFLWEILTPYFTVWPLSISEDVIYASVLTSCYAISTSEGKIIWKRDIGKEINSSPFLHDNLLYLCCFEPRDLFFSSGASPQMDHQPWIAALNRSNGQSLWQTQLGIDTRAKNVRSLAYASDKVFAPTDDGYITAINDKNGSVLWRSKTAGTLLSIPKVMNEVIYVGVNDGSIYAFHIEDGSLLWHTSIGDGVSLGFADVQL